MSRRHLNQIHEIEDTKWISRRFQMKSIINVDDMQFVLMFDHKVLEIIEWVMNVYLK